MGGNEAQRIIKSRVTLPNRVPNKKTTVRKIKACFSVVFKGSGASAALYNGIVCQAKAEFKNGVSKRISSSFSVFCEDSRSSIIVLDSSWDARKGNKCWCASPRSVDMAH